MIWANHLASLTKLSCKVSTGGSSVVPGKLSGFRGGPPTALSWIPREIFMFLRGLQNCKRLAVDQQMVYDAGGLGPPLLLVDTESSVKQTKADSSGSNTHSASGPGEHVNVHAVPPYPPALT